MGTRYRSKYSTGRSPSANEALIRLHAAPAGQPVPVATAATPHDLLGGSLDHITVAELVERGEARWVRRNGRFWAEAVR